MPANCWVDFLGVLFSVFVFTSRHGIAVHWYILGLYGRRAIIHVTQALCGELRGGGG